jgi:hypothetical protein
MRFAFIAVSLRRSNAEAIPSNGGMSGVAIRLLGRRDQPRPCSGDRVTWTNGAIVSTPYSRTLSDNASH